MDYKFPGQLFPNFYLPGPPESQLRHGCRSSGIYEHVLESSAAACENVELSKLQFESQHKMQGERWAPVEPIMTPLLSANEAGNVPSGPLPNPLDFPEQMQNFYQDHCVDAFSTMSSLVGEEFNFVKKMGVRMDQMHSFVSILNYNRCPFTYRRERVRRYYRMFGDVMCDIPPAVLADCVFEELTFQKEREQFQELTTGGAIVYVPLLDLGSRPEGCLIYPRGAALDTLNFHRVALGLDEADAPKVELSREPLTYSLNGSVRQISVGFTEGPAHVGVRSDHFCSVWIVEDVRKPRPKEVIQTKETATCLTVSPHIMGELLVTSESGAAHLWCMGKGLQKVREEDSNLYFNAKSSWRWCEFSAHPRVMVYADRTGAELTDFRSPDYNHTLFRIGKTGHCRSGERVILTKYLSEAHEHHHLITTQYSAYIMDERLPCVPMLKWDHMMQSPPMFVNVQSGASRDSTCKILLGAQNSQEMILLQYSGGREHACQSRSSPLKLSSPRESLRQLPVLLPHRQHRVQQRLQSPAAGLSAVRNDDFLYVFQLTEAGDVFYQTLRLHSDQTNISDDAPEHASVLTDVGNSVETVDKCNTTSSKDPKLSDGDFDKGRSRHAVLSQLDDPYRSDVSNVEPEMGDSRGVQERSNNLESSGLSTETNPYCATVPAIPEKTSKKLLLKWEDWLRSFFKVTQIIPKDRRPHWILRSHGLVSGNLSQEVDCFHELRGFLKATTERKDTLVHAVTHLPRLDVTPIPDEVDVPSWLDDVSQRLSVSWEGGWKSWWEDKLGMNRQKKIEALRKKRRQEKQARARNRVSLFGSFTSSISYQDNLSGWSSATSQELGSDFDSCPVSPAPPDQGLSELDLPHGSPVSEGLAVSNLTPQRKSEKASTNDQQISKDSQSERDLQRTVTTETDSVAPSTAASLKPTPQKRPIWQQQEYLSSLFGSQEPSQDTGQESTFSQLSVASSIQSFSSLSQTVPGVRLSRLSTQPKKKRSRMGF